MKKRYQIISWLAVILWMCLIFYLSHQPATESSELSAGIMMIVLGAVEKGLPFIHIETESFHFLIRKGAHFFAYFMLGIFIVNALRSSGLKGVQGIVAAFFISVIYATSDETHQLFIPGRSGEIRDVLIDSAGSLTGIIVYILFTIVLKKLSIKNRKKGE